MERLEAEAMTKEGHISGPFELEQQVPEGIAQIPVEIPQQVSTEALQLSTEVPQTELEGSETGKRKVEELENGGDDSEEVDTKKIKIGEIAV